MSDATMLDPYELLSDLPESSADFSKEQMLFFNLGCETVRSLDQNDLIPADPPTTLVYAIAAVHAYRAGQGKPFKLPREKPLLAAFLAGYSVKCQEIAVRKIGDLLASDEFQAQLLEREIPVAAHVDGDTRRITMMRIEKGKTHD